MDNVPARRWWALASIASAQFLAVVDAFIVNVALPSIRADLNASAAEIQSVVDGVAPGVIASEAKQSHAYRARDCFVAPLLAMTRLTCGSASIAPVPGMRSGSPAV